MKRTLLFIGSLLLFSIATSAQSSGAFKYQAVARDIGGQILANQSVSFRISILKGSASGSSVYSETHTVNTNAFGLVNLEIGNGEVASGNFSAIEWGADTYFTQIEMDETGGSTYLMLGTSQLLSVPYALHALHALHAKTAEYVPNLPSPLQIGDTHAGGIIFYLDPDGVHGLVAAPSDQSTGAAWGCDGTDISGAPNVTNFPPTGPGADIGWGAVNTAAIVNNCETVDIAARLCDTLVLNGYSDWFLPSAEELNFMYINLHLAGLGGFAACSYWSSTEFDSEFAWFRFFNYGGTHWHLPKTFYMGVRAVRAF